MGAIGTAALLLGCPAPPPGPGGPPLPDPDGSVIVTRGPACEDPVDDGGRWSRPDDVGLDFVPEGDDALTACPRVPGGLVASDLDDDGDIDLVFVRRSGFPALYANAGDGTFTAVAAGPQGPARDTLAALAADLDGDRQPELILVGEGFAAVARNLGGLSFDDPVPIWFEEVYPVACYQSASVGDLDGDGDLDLLLPGLDPVEAPGVVPVGAVPEVGTPDRLLLGDGTGGFVHALDLAPPAGPWLSMAAAFTDRDGDGDLDILVLPDRGRDGRPGASFFRNDGPLGGGLPLLVDDAEALGADIHPDGMGLLAEDLTGDGHLDYCVSDLLGELRCLVADEVGYHEAGAALGLVSAAPAHPDWDLLSGQWSPWSLDAVDVDNDGDLDIAAAAGAPPGPGGVAATAYPGVQPDALFERGESGFIDRSEDLAWWDQGGWSYGLAAADLMRDGAPDLVQARYAEPPVVRANACGRGHWVVVQLDGPAGNRQGFGATVEVTVGPETRSRELPSLRGVGQSPAELHFGLGDAVLIDGLVVRWSDGEVTARTGLPVDAQLRVRHPSRL